MNRSFIKAKVFPLLLLIPFFLCVALVSSTFSSIKYSSATLPNGLQVFIFPNPGTSSVAIDLWVRAGSRYDPPEKSGLAHFVEHLLFKGTSLRTAFDISREMAAMGGRMNAYTQWDYGQFHIQVLPQYFPQALEILADIVQNSLFSEEMIEKERRVILEEISLANIYPPSYILNLIAQTLFPENPLGQPITGTKESVNNISRADLIKFYKDHYVPNNSNLTVVGNIEPSKILTTIEEKLNSWVKGAVVPSPPSPAQLKQFREVYKRKFLDQAILVLALQAPGLGDADRPVFEIINALLGAGAHSRLYQEIREKNALSYLVGSIYYPLSDTGIWTTYAGTDPKNIKKIRAIFRQHLKKIKEEPISPEELAQVKNYIYGRMVMRLENNHALADFLGPHLLSSLTISPVEFLARIQKVSSQDIQWVAQKYFREENLCLFILKPYPGLRLFRGLF